MKIVMTSMNGNSKLDPSNLNISSNSTQHDGGLGAGDGERRQQQRAVSATSGGDQPDMSNLEYLKNLADVLANQGGGDGNNNHNQNSSIAAASVHGFTGGNNFQGASSNNNNNAAAGGNNNDFLHMQSNNHGSDTDTCASSQYNMRRVSKDSLVSRDSLSDMLSADQVASNNLAMMNMLANQQQQQQMGNQNFGNFNHNANNQQHQALNQSMSQLMMNGSMNMNSMTSAAASMMNNSMTGGAGGWNSNNSNPMNMNDPSLLGAYGIEGGGKGTAPLLIPPKKTKNKHKQTFAQKLMHILSIKECHGSIRWMPNGCAFCIVDSKRLVETVLPKYFKEAKYTSFTRKLNRWGFKHFTLPTSEPSADKEMSIYTHEKFLRDNPDLCQQMDGGHRRRNSQKEPNDAPLGLGAASQGNVHQDASNVPQLQQQNMMIQQMQQMQQQNIMMQQLQAQQQQMNQNQASQAPSFDMATMNNMGQGGGGSNFNSMMGSAFNNNSNPLAGNQGNMNLMDSGASGPVASSAMGMRRTSLGFMPYLPTSNRRDSGFSIGGLSTVSNDLAGSFTAGGGGMAAVAGLGGMAGNSTQSLEKFRKMSPMPTAVAGDMTNATFDDYRIASGGGNNAAQQGYKGEGKVGEQGENGGDGNSHEDIRHSQAKLAVLEDMIAKERRKQSLLSSLDPDPVSLS